MSILTAYDKFVQQALKYGFSLWGPSKTGQTVKYVAGDDGTYEMGYPKVGARFVDNGDGTVTDNATGLTWAKLLNADGCNNDTPLAWAAAVTYVVGLNFAGHSDWRLPNAIELHTLVDYGRITPCINPIFSDASIASMWTSTTDLVDTANAWMVNFNNGYVYFSAKSGSLRVRAVRGNV